MNTARRRFAVAAATAVAFAAALSLPRPGSSSPQGAPPAAQTSPVSRLEPGKTVSREIRGGETHQFQFDLKAGQYARVEVAPESLHVAVSLFAPDGKTLARMDGKEGRLWRQTVSCVAEADGSFRAEVKAHGAADAARSYTIRLTEPRRPEPADLKRIEAEARLSAGRELYDQGGSRIGAAIEEFEAALKLWPAAGERAWEAVTLVNLGWAYADSSEPEQAIAAHARAVAIFRELGDKAGEAKAANGLGLVYSGINPQDRARGFYEQALGIRRALGDKAGEGNTLANLGDLYFGAAQHEKARGYYEQALAVWREVKDRFNEAAALNGLGLVDEALNRHPAALDHFAQSLNIYRALDNKYAQAVILSNIGRTHAAAKDEARALSHYAQSLALYREIGDRQVEAALLNSVGIFHENAGRAAEALKSYTDALALYRAVGSKADQAYVLNNVGDAHKLLSDAQSALASYGEAAALYRELGDKGREAGTLANIAEVHLDLSGKTVEALGDFNGALALYREASDRRGEARMLNEIGTVWMLLDDKQKAIDHFSEALRIYQAIGDRAEEADTLSGISSAYVASVLPEKALGYFEAALKIYRELGDREKEAVVLMGLSSLYAMTDEKEKARSHLDQATAMLSGLGSDFSRVVPFFMMALADDEEEAMENMTKAFAHYDRRTTRLPDEKTEDYVVRLLMVGVSNLLSGEKQKASEYLERGLEVSRQEKDRALEAMMLMFKGMMEAESQPQASIENLRAASEIASALGVKSLETLIDFMLGAVYDSLYEKDKNAEHLAHASSHLNRTLISYRAATDRNMEAHILTMLMELWEDGGQPQLAIVYGKQAVGAFQSVRAGLRDLDKRLQDSYLKRVGETYRHLAELLISAGRLPEAQAVLDLLKEEEFGQLSVRRGGEGSDTVPYSRAEADVIAKIENLVALERRRAELQKALRERGALSVEQQQTLDRLRLDIAAANRAFDEALDALGRAEVSAATRVDEIKNGRELQSALGELRRDTGSGVVALYTVLGTEEAGAAAGGGAGAGSRFGWVIMVTEKGYKAYPIAVANLEEMVFQFRAALSSDAYDPRPLAEKIYAAVFRQTAPNLKRTLEDDLREHLGPHKDRTLMWSLDGVLRYIPMAALHDGDKYLVESYRNVVFTRQSFLWLTDDGRPRWRALGLGVSEGRESFSALPGVRTELEAIIRERGSDTGVLSGVIRLNENFRKQAFFDTVSGGSFPVVHIASHYSFNPSRLDASFLLAGDGRLTFGEMKEEKNLFGTVDLLTLSACDTGVSGNGKEAEGFAYLAQSLGAKSVVASLWKVSDVGVAELMIRFYRLRAESPRLPKGEALRRAQLALLQGQREPRTGGREDVAGPAAPAARDVIVEEAGTGGKVQLPRYERRPGAPYAHPYYWAPFILIGNWK